MKTPLQQLMDYMLQNQYFIGNDLLSKYNDLKMSKAYLVIYSEGSYEDVTYNNVFITFDEQKAIDYVNKFNRILLKCRKEYNNGKWLYGSILETIYYREVNYAIYKEIEVR